MHYRLPSYHEEGDCDDQRQHQQPQHQDDESCFVRKQDLKGGHVADFLNYTQKPYTERSGVGIFHSRYRIGCNKCNENPTKSDNETASETTTKKTTMMKMIVIRTPTRLLLTTLPFLLVIGIFVVFNLLPSDFLFFNVNKLQQQGNRTRTTTTNSSRQTQEYRLLSTDITANVKVGSSESRGRSSINHDNDDIFSSLRIGGGGGGGQRQRRKRRIQPQPPPSLHSTAVDVDVLDCRLIDFDETLSPTQQQLQQKVVDTYGAECVISRQNSSRGRKQIIQAIQNDGMSYQIQNLPPPKTFLLNLNREAALDVIYISMTDVAIMKETMEVILADKSTIQVIQAAADSPSTGRNSLPSSSSSSSSKTTYDRSRGLGEEGHRDPTTTTTSINEMNLFSDSQLRHGGRPQRQQVVPSSASLSSSSTKTTAVDALNCQLVEVETLYEEDNRMRTEETVECVPLRPEGSNSRVSQELQTTVIDYDTSYRISNLPQDFMEHNENEIEQGILYVTITDITVADDTVEVVLSASSKIQFIDPPISSTSTTSSTNGRDLIVRGPGGNQPGSAINTNAIGRRTVAVVRVSTTDSQVTATAKQIHDTLFASSRTNFISQYRACSFNQLQFVRSKYGVLDVKLYRPIASFANAAEVIKLAQYKYVHELRLQNPQDLADHVMFCLPPGSGKWAASAGVNFWRSQFNNEWCTSLTATVHELGHNLGLLHSNESGEPYGDRTGFMAGGYKNSDWPIKCFNGHKNWYLGWYRFRHIRVDPFQIIGPKMYKIAAFVDYQKAKEDEPVVVNVLDRYYLQYNRAKSFNRETEEKRNQVTVTEDIPKGSENRAGLSVGDRFESTIVLPDNLGGAGGTVTLIIELCGYVMGDDYYGSNTDIEPEISTKQDADIVVVSIGIGQSLCPAVRAQRHYAKPTVSTSHGHPRYAPPALSSTTARPTTIAPTTAFPTSPSPTTAAPTTATPTTQSPTEPPTTLVPTQSPTSSSSDDEPATIEPAGMSAGDEHKDEYGCDKDEFGIRCHGKNKNKTSKDKPGTQPSSPRTPSKGKGSSDDYPPKSKPEADDHDDDRDCDGFGVLCGNFTKDDDEVPAPPLPPPPTTTTSIRSDSDEDDCDGDEFGEICGSHTATDDKVRVPTAASSSSSSLSPPTHASTVEPTSNSASKDYDDYTAEPTSMAPTTATSEPTDDLEGKYDNDCNEDGFGVRCGDNKEVLSTRNLPHPPPKSENSTHQAEDDCNGLGEPCEFDAANGDSTTPGQSSDTNDDGCIKIGVICDDNGNRLPPTVHSPESSNSSPNKKPPPVYDDYVPVDGRLPEMSHEKTAPPDTKSSQVFSHDCNVFGIPCSVLKTIAPANSSAQSSNSSSEDEEIDDIEMPTMDPSNFTATNATAEQTMAPTIGCNESDVLCDDAEVLLPLLNETENTDNETFTDVPTEPPGDMTNSTSTEEDCGKLGIGCSQNKPDTNLPPQPVTSVTDDEASHTTNDGCGMDGILCQASDKKPVNEGDPPSEGPPVSNNDNEKQKEASKAPTISDSISKLKDELNKDCGGSGIICDDEAVKKNGKEDSLREAIRNWKLSRSETRPSPMNKSKVKSTEPKPKPTHSNPFKGIFVFSRRKWEWEDKKSKGPDVMEKSTAEPLRMPSPSAGPAEIKNNGTQIPSAMRSYSDAISSFLKGGPDEGGVEFNRIFNHQNHPVTLAPTVALDNPPPDSSKAGGISTQKNKDFLGIWMRLAQLSSLLSYLNGKNFGHSWW